MFLSGILTSLPKQQDPRLQISGMVKGFTLIELLVVVLIIGILAAVAVPQYKIAVYKSRLAAVIPTVKAMKQAVETYYLNNGEYIQNLDAYDIGFPCTTYNGNNSSRCETATTIWNVRSNVNMCQDVSAILINENREGINSYGMCLDYSHRPGVRYCGAAQNDSAANQVCKNLGGTYLRYGSCAEEGVLSNKCNFYLLPN